MIELISGLPGAGKGIYSIIRIIEELRNTDRPIITNFAIELHPWIRRLGRRRRRAEKGMLAHLLDEYGETFNAEKRIHVLTDEQIAKFYLWRADATGKLIEIQANRDKDGSITSINADQWANTAPCCYLVDEAWKFWNSREWQKADKGFQFYNAQHRKAGDDIMITVQNASQIDKQLRVLVQTYHSLVNHRHRKMFVFKQPNVITVITSNEPPDNRQKSLSDIPKVIRFDPVGVGGCFDTAKGAGVQGQGADIEKKTKGMPWWGIFILLFGIGFLIVALARGGGWLTGSLLTGSFSKPEPKKTKSEMPSLNPAAGVLKIPVVPDPVKVVAMDQKPSDGPPVFIDAVTMMPEKHVVRGRQWVTIEEHWRVDLSNGATLISLDPAMQILTEDYVVYRGRTNYTRRAVSRLSL